MDGRKPPEWIGKSADRRPPPRVRARVFLTHGGKCHISGRAIRPGDAWELDHVIALVNGGENRESNLAPALKVAHKAKTALDVAEKAKVARVRAKHLGIQEKRQWGHSRFKKKLDGTVIDRTTGEPV